MLSKHFRNQLLRISRQHFRKKEPLDLKKQILTSSKKIKHKETVKSMSSFRNFVDKSIKDNTLSNKMRKTAK
jgi:hypothetical protein